MSDLEVMHTASDNGIFEHKLIEECLVVRRTLFLS
jgi:hypothetical protein